MSAGDDQRRASGSDGIDAPDKQGAGIRQASGGSSTARTRGNSANAAGNHHAHDVPRWRQIEIMRERRALRELLDDIDADDLEFEEEVFGSEAEREVYYRAAGDDPEEDEEEPLVLGDEEAFEDENE